MGRVQGLTENVQRLRNSPVMNTLIDHPEWMPLLFNDVGVEIPFPMPDQPLPPVKPRGQRNVAAPKPVAQGVPRNLVGLEEDLLHEGEKDVSGRRVLVKFYKEASKEGIFSYSV